MKKCEVCGTKVNPKDSFCTGCGNPIPKEEVKDDVIEEKKEKKVKKVKKEESSTFYMILIIILLLLIIGLGIFQIFFN